MTRPFSEEFLRDPELTRIVAHAARLARIDPDDFHQELFLRLRQAEGRFDPERGTRPAFLATLAYRLRVDFQGRHLQRQRHVETMLGSVREPPNVRLDPNTTPERLELLRDVAEWLTTLSDELRVLAEQLKSESLTSIARQRGTPRSTLQRQVRELRTAYDRFRGQTF